MGDTKLILSGGTGRMGQEINKIVAEVSALEVVESVGRNAKFSKTDAKLVIDFSNPELFEQALDFCLANNMSFVSGTTGLNSSHFERLKSAAEKIPVLWAANMSVGVAIMNRLVAEVGAFSKNFDFQIEEVHHSKKVDSPSGTAIQLQKTLENSSGKKEPAPLSIRGGGVFGIHRLLAMSQEETLSIEHQALTRTVFARGAVVAAQWISQQGPGLYTMENVLGWKK